MANLANRNSQVISSAFARFRQSTEDCFRRGMEQVMEFAMQDALENHDDFHTNHLRLGGTYGWIVFHNGVEVSRRIQGSGDGDVTEKLGEVPHHTNGWCGIVMAGMTPIEYFAINAEFAVLRETINDMKINGTSRFFKRIV